MTTNVVFIQGAGAGAHENEERLRRLDQMRADRLLADSLRASLGPEFEVRYPDHLARNAANVPGAISRELETGGHQFGNDLGVVARDIRTIVEGGVLR